MHVHVAPTHTFTAGRYIILYHYGGFYMDLDVECRQPISEWLSLFKDEVRPCDSTPTATMFSGVHVPALAGTVHQRSVAGAGICCPAQQVQGADICSGVHADAVVHGVLRVVTAVMLMHVSRAPHHTIPPFGQ